MRAFLKSSASNGVRSRVGAPDSVGRRERILLVSVDELPDPQGHARRVPPDSARRRALVAHFATMAAAAGYGEVVPPLLEDLGVFLRVG